MPRWRYDADLSDLVKRPLDQITQADLDAIITNPEKELASLIGITS